MSQEQGKDVDHDLVDLIFRNKTATVTGLIILESSE